MTLHTDQATLDHWRTTGTWVLFGEGERCPNASACLSAVNWHNVGGPEPECECEARQSVDRPPAWMVGAAKPCGACHGRVEMFYDQDPDLPIGDCLTCDDGRQRHTITVQCGTYLETQMGSNFDGKRGAGTGLCEHEPPCVGGRITVPELAVVEWGPERVAGWSERVDGCLVVQGGALWRWHDHTMPDGVLVRIILPPDIDPQSLVGQYAIGGRLVTP